MTDINTCPECGHHMDWHGPQGCTFGGFKPHSDEWEGCECKREVVR